MLETFVDIPGYKGRYQISDMGRVKSLSRKIVAFNRFKIIKYITEDKILIPEKNKSGYLYVGLFDRKNKRTKHRVNRLVLLSFIGKSKLHCNHKNGIKTDNRLLNLEYCTPSQNIQHAKKNKLLNPPYGENHCCSKLKERDVLYIKRQKGKITATELGRKFGVGHNAISSIWHGINWKHVKEEN